MKYKIVEKKIIMMGVVEKFYKVEANSEEEAIKKIEDFEVDSYDTDYDIEQTEHLEYIIEED